MARRFDYNRTMSDQDLLEYRFKIERDEEFVRNEGLKWDPKLKIYDYPEMIQKREKEASK